MTVRTHNSTSRRHRPDVGRRGPALSLRASVPACVRAFRAFSLAEMMISLAILAMGLLVIGAALPIGVRYTRESINMATGEAAAAYGLDLMEQSLCIPDKVLDTTGDLIREAALFVPRQSDPPDPAFPDYVHGQFIPNYEPLIKVHALFARIVDATPGSAGLQDNLGYGVTVEGAVRAWLGGDDPKECDNLQDGPWMRWPLPAVAMAYPPITPNTVWVNGGPAAGRTEYVPADFLPPRNSYTGWQFTTEARKIYDRRVAWTGFYRRVMYADTSGATGQAGDPYVYELISVAVRRPSSNSRFPLQDPADGGAFGTSALGLTGLAGVDTATPVPWLVSLTALAAPPLGVNTTTGMPLFGAGGPPATVFFNCAPSRSPLFPVGAIFIPARNDLTPSGLATGSVRVGLSPPSPNALPIYEVVERPNNTTLVVKYNGFYPVAVVGGNYTVIPGSNADMWPVWVIPPAYEEGTTAAPVIPDRNSILAVARRTVRLRGIP